MLSQLFNKLQSVLLRREEKYLYQKFYLKKGKDVVLFYKNWLKNNIKSYKNKALRYQPLISIVVNKNGPSDRFLNQCIKSIQGQSYKNWELLISEKDKTGSINPKGDFVGFLDIHDFLTPNALYETVAVLNSQDHIDFIYSDYAILNKHDEPQDICFLPDFSRYYFLSNPDFIKFGFIRRTLAKKKYFQLKDTHITHIPKVLYYRRKYLEKKNNTNPKFSIRNDSKTPKPLISIIIPTSNNWKMLQKCMRSIEEKSGYNNFEIIIVGNNTSNHEAKEYIDSLRNKYIVLDYSHRFNFSLINNYAVKYAKGEFLLFLNDDIEFITDNSLNAMRELFEIKDVGAVGIKLLFPNNTIQHAGVVVGLNGSADHIYKFINEYADEKKHMLSEGYMKSLVSIREYSAVTAACMMTRKNLFLKIGGFSEKLKVGFNDVDYCLQCLKSGYRVLYTPHVKAYHYEHVSRKEIMNKTGDNSILYHPQDGQLFVTKWGEYIKKGDPYYNPNFRSDSLVPLL